MHRHTIFTRAFWREYVVDARRMHKDGRARKSFLLRNLFVLYLVAYVGYNVMTFHQLHDTASEIVLGCLLVVVFLVIIAVKWTQHRESQRQLAEDIASAPSQTVQALQHTAFALAAMAERALGELWLRKNTVPEGKAVVTRRIQIDTLKSRNIWDDLPLEVRDWMARPDGSWPPERIAQVLASAETLHSLLWTLGLEHKLRPMESLAKPMDFAKLSRNLQKPAPGVRPTWDIRLARNEATTYFLRCHAENIHRKRIEAETPEQGEAVEAWLATISAGDAPEAMSGADTVAEVEMETLDIIGRSAACRSQTLSYVMAMLDGADEGELRAFAFAPLTLPLQEVPDET